MSVDKAIDTYVDLVSKVFSARQIGRDGKFNTKTFEDAIKSIVMNATNDVDECMLDQRNDACKV